MAYLEKAMVTHYLTRELDTEVILASLLAGEKVVRGALKLKIGRL